LRLRLSLRRRLVLNLRLGLRRRRAEGRRFAMLALLARLPLHTFALLAAIVALAELHAGLRCGLRRLGEGMLGRRLRLRLVLRLRLRLRLLGLLRLDGLTVPALARFAAFALVVLFPFAQLAHAALIVPAAVSLRTLRAELRLRLRLRRGCGCGAAAGGWANGVAGACSCMRFPPWLMLFLGWRSPPRSKPSPRSRRVSMTRPGVTAPGDMRVSGSGAVDKGALRASIDVNDTRGALPTFTVRRASNCSRGSTVTPSRRTSRCGFQCTLFWCCQPRRRS
jgi:hypothetical protein